MEEKKPKFDPVKKYNWDPEAQFILNGRDFGLILNTFRLVLTSQQSQLLNMVDQAASRMDLALMRAVEEGIAREVPEPQKENTMSISKNEKAPD